MRIRYSFSIYDAYLNSKIQESTAQKVSELILQSQYKLFPTYNLHHDIFTLYII